MDCVCHLGSQDTCLIPTLTKEILVKIGSGSATSEICRNFMKMKFSKDAKDINQQ